MEPRQMTPSQLRQWSFQNSQPDQWWLNLDAVTEEVPVTVAEIEERLKSGDYSTVQALHVSQAGMANAPWVEVAMPLAMRAPPVMQPPLAASAPASPTPASSLVSAQTTVGESAKTMSERSAGSWAKGIGFLTTIFLGYVAYLIFQLPGIMLVSYIVSATVFFLLKNFGR